MSTKHTPGPWSVVEHSWSDCSVIDPNFDHGICSLDINHATEESQAADEAQMLANARLIAAAPELLEALQALLDSATNEDGEWYREARAKARAAIAKATGSAA